MFKDPRRAAQRWREELRADQIRTVERHLADSCLAEYWSASPLA